MNTSEKSVVPHGMSSNSHSTLHAEDLMSNPPVSAYDRENWSNPSTGYIPTYDMYSTKYPAISYDSNTNHCRLSSSPTIVMSVVKNIKQTKKNANKHQHIKRPINSFMIWYLYRRQEIALANPNWHVTEISKKLGAEWKLLTIEEKQPFIDEAKRLIEQHKKDYPDYKFRVKRKPKCVMNTFKPSVSHSMSSCSPPNFDAREFMSNPRISAYDRENASNSPTGYNPTYGMYSTTYPAISYDSNTHCAESWTSMTAHNAQSQAVPPYQYTYMHSEQNACGHVMNLNDSVLSNTSSPSLSQHCSAEQLQQTGQSFIHL